jgi:hypothetical protein
VGAVALVACLLVIGLIVVLKAAGSAAPRTIQAEPPGPAVVYAQPQKPAPEKPRKHTVEVALAPAPRPALPPTTPPAPISIKALPHANSRNIPAEPVVAVEVDHPPGELFGDIPPQ